MTSPIFYIAPVRDWLWKHELAEIFCISRVTLWDWLKRLDDRELIEGYKPMSRKLPIAQIERICYLLDYPFSACLERMNQAYTINKMIL